MCEINNELLAGFSTASVFPPAGLLLASPKPPWQDSFSSHPSSAAHFWPSICHTLAPKSEYNKIPNQVASFDF